MKHLLLLVALLLASPLAHAQKAKEDDSTPTLPRDPDTKQVTYTGVVEVPGATQAQLYSRAFEWVAKRYNSAKDVVQMQDKESGKIVVKGITTGHAAKGHEYGTVTHTFSLYMKDGKYKYDITNFRHEYFATGRYAGDYSLGPFEDDEPKLKMALANGAIKKSWNILRRNTEADIKALITDLEATMTAKIKDKSDF